MTMPAATCEEIGVEVRDGIGTISLRRPAKRNAVTTEMWHAIIAATSALATRDVRLLVLRGTDGVFCAGADLASVKDADGNQSDEFLALAVEALTAIALFPAPSVALIEGACIGGGCSLALACDFRFARPDAILGVPAVRHKIIYDHGSLARLVELMGPARAARFIYTAERVDGALAAELGLVDECTDDLNAALRQLAEPLLLGDPHTIAVTRGILRGQTSV